MQQQPPMATGIEAFEEAHLPRSVRNASKSLQKPSKRASSELEKPFDSTACLNSDKLSSPDRSLSSTCGAHGVERKPGTLKAARTLPNLGVYAT